MNTITKVPKFNLKQSEIVQHTPDKGGRTYEVDGIHLPSVTTIINTVMNKPALVPWAYNIGVAGTFKYMKEFYSETSELPTSDGLVKLALAEQELDHTSVMKNAGSRGSDIHRALEGIINQEEYEFDPENKSYINTLEQFVEDYAPEWLLTEMKVADTEHEFAGTFDTVAVITKHPKRKRHESLIGKVCMIDVKSNKDGRVYPESHFPQVEAYGMALKRMSDGRDWIDRRVVVGIGLDGKYQVAPSYGREETFMAILVLYNELKRMKEQNPNKRS